MTRDTWHAKAPDEVLAATRSGPDGLSGTEAAKRLHKVGPNRTRPPARASVWRIFVDQLTSVVVFLLLAAVGISLALGDLVEAAAIGVVLVINTTIGFWTELKARRAMEALAGFDTGRASVVRDGRLQQIGSEAVVPGDVIQLGAGERVPADGRLIDSTDLQADEAALTGESLPVSKETTVELDTETALADRRNMVYKGTAVVAGSGRAVVTETGADTEIGRIGTLVGGLAEERTPLEQRLDTLGRHLAWLAVAIAALVAALGAIQGSPLGLVLELGIALAVAAVPEALPAVATIALAVGLHRMARRHALVRRLPAVEALGSTTVVCTDKTRTLTSGEMTVVEVWTHDAFTRLDEFGDRNAQRPLVEGLLLAAAVASRPQAGSEGETAAAGGDPVDRAALEAAAGRGIDRDGWLAAHPERDFVPFSSRRQLLASFHEEDGRTVAYVKGAPGRIAELCASVETADGSQPLGEEDRESVLGRNQELAARGLRVLAVARGEADSTDENGLRDLTFLGLLGLLDPPATGVKDTIAKLDTAGLRTIMLTGDQRLTAQAIGRQLGLTGAAEAVIDGRELDGLSADELRTRVRDVGVFSRISPEHKLRIVEALQSHGEIVAMLGDGVNDAPALKRANVGVAMGQRGTDVAREAADIVLQDDRFETIGAAVEEGRVIYDNIRKFVFYLFSCNLAEILVLLIATLAGLPLPLLPLQILWLNMVTDTIPALALAMEPADQTVMTRPPRPPAEALLSRRFLGSMAFYAALITAVTLVSFVGALDGDADRARTMAFMTLALAQILHLGNARSAAPVLSRGQALANPYALAAVGISIGLQLMALHLAPLARVLRVVPLEAADLALVFALGLVPAVIGQTLKLIRVEKAHMKR